MVSLGLGATWLYGKGFGAVLGELTEGLMFLVALCSDEPALTECNETDTRTPRLPLEDVWLLLEVFEDRDLASSIDKPELETNNTPAKNTM